jgi:hypothetical protein
MDLVAGYLVERLEAACRCGETLHDVSSLVTHIIHSHPSSTATIFNCCGELFSTLKPTWLDHLKTEHNCGPKPLPCTARDCPQRFPKLDPLRKHINYHHAPETHCDCHGVPFKGPVQLKEHLRREEKKREKEEMEMVLDVSVAKRHCHASKSHTPESHALESHLPESHTLKSQTSERHALLSALYLIPAWTWRVRVPKMPSAHSYVW